MEAVGSSPAEDEVQGAWLIGRTAGAMRNEHSRILHQPARLVHPNPHHASRPSPDHPVAKLMPWAADVRAQRLP